MALTTMYPGKVNSPELTLTSDINDSIQTIEVTGDITKLPSAPNIFVIGTGEDAETIYYPTDAATNVFSGVTRAFQGTAKAWTSGEPISRLFTAYDYDTLRTNITTLDSEKVAKTDYNAYTILYADSDDTPTALTVGASTIVGRKSTGGIVALTATEARTILNVEDGADVTDATNVNSAGAVMESDYNAYTILAADTDNTPAALTVSASTIVGRKATGGIVAINVADTNTLLGTVIKTDYDANTILHATSDNTPVAVSCTAAGLAVLDDANAAAQRVTLGVSTKSIFLPAYSGIQAYSNSATLYQGQTADSTDLATSNFPLPYAKFTVAGRTTERLCFIAQLPDDWNGSTVNATIGWSANSTSTNNVVWLLYAIRITEATSLAAAGGTPALIATFTADPNKSTAYSLNEIASTGLTITGTGNTVLFEVKRNTTGDDLAADALFVGLKIAYTV